MMKSTKHTLSTLDTTSQSFNKQEIEHELTAHRAAVERLRRDLLKLRQQVYFSASIPARAKITQMVLPFSEALVQRVEQIKQKAVGKRAYTMYHFEMIEVLDKIEPEVVSLIFLKSAFDAAGAFDRLHLQKVTNWIGGRIEDEMRYRFYQETGSEQLKMAASKRVSCTNSSPHYRSYSTKFISRQIAQAEGTPVWEAWSPDKRCGIAMFLAEIAFEAGILTVIKPFVAPSRRQSFIVFTDQFLSHQDQILTEVESLVYHAWPLLNPPLDWQLTDDQARHNYTGGYHHELLRNQLPLCRGGHYRSTFGQRSIDFLNVIGRTGWEVDKAIFETASTLFTNGVSVGSLRTAFDRSVLDQPMPHDLQDLATDHHLRKEWRHQKTMLYEAHAKAVKRSVRAREALTLARQFLTHPRFYLSWSYDYRGRAYSQQPFLQPQSTEIERSLIRFSEGCRLDDTGIQWVERAIGGSYLGTRGSFEQREQWAQSNRDLIKALATNPLDLIDHWQDADEPFHLLQLCNEYNDVLIERTKELWSVPIQVDATSSGLQILSAAMCDPIGCRFSNVLPGDGDAPEDAYLAVVTKAKELCRTKDDWNEYEQFFNGRELGKCSLMVAVYGGSHGTRTKRLIKVLSERGHYPNPITWNKANEMAVILQRASEQTFPKAFAALNWIRKLAKTSLANGSQEFCWSTASGDRIALRELERTKKTIKTSHLGQISVTTGYGQGIKPNEMIKALAPSWVHSLDASILKIAFDGWTQPLSTIHDCIAVLPTDMEYAQDRLRLGFLETVNGDPLARLANDLEVSAEQLPLIPQGTAEIKGVLKSKFLFN